MNASDAALSSLTDKFPGPCPHTFGVLKFTALTTGKNTALPSGTEHVRVAVPPPKVPAKNHREPRWPTIQFSPVGSSWGFTDVGIESAHCCHRGPNSSRSSDS